jgi:bifunctional non-homologous end joining protein LigD
VIAKPLRPIEARETRATGARTRNESRLLPEQLEGAVKAALPRKLSPQLATLSKTVPSGRDWLCEIKFDGYRVMARIDKREVRLVTRGGHDWSAKMKSLASAVAALDLQSTWLDGEIVVMNGDGVPDFNALQNAFDSARTDGIVYYLFDLPHFEGYDLRRVPLHQRRALLRQLLEAKAAGDRIRFSEEFPGDVASVLAQVCRLRLEGVIAKRPEAPYVSERTESWLKLKCSQRQEFVIGGFVDRSGAAAEVGSLLLGVHNDDGQLVYAGNVGTGWDGKTARDLHRKLSELEIDQSPFDVRDPGGRGRWSRRTAAAVERWVEPKLVAEVSFAEWTPDGHVRHASFQGLRTDKAAAEIVREHTAEVAAVPAPVAAPTRATPKTTTTKVSNPDRIIDPSTGLKKLDLVRYYESVADWILPHLIGRPVSLVRGPTGVGGELFFQKHGDKLGIPGIRELDASLWPGHLALLEIDNVQALVGAAQMNVIELHTWNSTVDNIDKPDRVVFDLDPGEGVAWVQLQEAAVLTHTMLNELGLRSWLKTSGGKGLHVLVPLAPRLDYDNVNGFAKAVVQHLAATIPSRFVAKSGASNRTGRIFVDYLRNGHGATTVAAYSARARPGLGVSMPVAWEELSSLKSGAHWPSRRHVSTCRSRRPIHGPLTARLRRRSARP